MPTKATQQTRKAAENQAVTSTSTQSPQSSHASITSALAADSNLTPTQAAERLFPQPSAAKRGLIRFRIKEQLEEGRSKHWYWHKGAVHSNNREPDDEELRDICQRYGYSFGDDNAPSRLYLMMLADALLPQPRDPMAGVVSPPLLATTGIIPLSIFSMGPDIFQHYYDCIVAARKEVVLQTNYWQNGKNVDRIAEAFRELNRRVQQRKEAKANSAPLTNGDAAAAAGAIRKGADVGDGTEDIVVKVMWDRGPQTVADLFRLRKPVPPSMWKANGLPTQEEIPNLKMEILNYHRPLMGTFHAKLLVVDRQVALINSNNIQDRPNIEACTRLEGDIVNSVYDHALISWGDALNPTLPCLDHPADAHPGLAAFETGDSSTLPSMTTERMRELSQSIRKQLLEDDEETEAEKERDDATSPLGRLTFSDMIDSVMRSPKPGVNAKAAAGHATPIEGSTNQTTTSDTMTPADKENAARKAGQLWAQKVLGERFRDFQARRQASSGSLQGEMEAAAAGSPTTTAPPRRNFADVVEALMKKEGIKPGGWTEGALEAFGLGPSSSRNVADAVRKNRIERGAPKDAAARGIDVPQAVREELSPNNTAPNSPNGALQGRDNSSVPASPLALHPTEGPGVVDESTSLGSAAKKLTADEPESSGVGVVVSEASAPKPESDAGVSEALPNGVPIQTNGDSDPLMTPLSTDEKRLSVQTGGGDSDRAGAVYNNHTTTSDVEEGTPGSSAFRAHLRRTHSNLSRISAAERLENITKSLDFANLSQVQGEIKAAQLAVEGVSSNVLDFEPYTLHKAHEPVPMALVNRRPHGTPGHNDIRNPQDAAWLAGFRYAKEHVFIQSPTLNASPIKAAVLAAVRRGVRVELWLDLGFNDKSESMPFQGGTNESVVTKFYRTLRSEGKGHEKNLEVYWYTGKDMTRPLNAVRKQRNCHVKFASFDGHVAILGSGNQDTQSWFHSQEINVMVDSREIVQEWMMALERNQSTKRYGRVDGDGIWRGKTGSEVVDSGK